MSERLQSQTLDLLVIGGGVTGAGILLDAVSRRMKPGLVEMQDFAAGTSSRSTKLVHGGLRYLKQFDIDLVAEVGRERAIVYENAPHVTTPLWMLLPIIKRGTYGMFMSAVGLYVYDRLAEVRHEERRKMLSRTEALEKEPLLRSDDLKGAGYYVEYRTDDARLTLEIMKEAVARGATAVNYTKAEQLLYDPAGKVIGARMHDLVTDTHYDVHALKVINATGPWVDELREQDGSKNEKTMHLTKGVHIVVDASRFPLRNPVYYDVPDGRMVFAIPRAGKTYVGTTDTNFHGDVRSPRTTKADRDYLIDCVNTMFPSVALTGDDVESFWAGVRPLIHEQGKGPSEISRRDEVFVSPSGLLTIAGGKLTGYRVMADKVVSMAARQLAEETGVDFGRCQTEKIELSGGKFGGSQNMADYLTQQVEVGVSLGLTRDEARKLAERYGTNVPEVWEVLMRAGDGAASEAQDCEDEAPEDQVSVDQDCEGTVSERPASEDEACGELSKEVYAALVYGINHEMVVTPSDFFIRRTAAMFFDIAWVHQWKVPVIRCMAKFYGWSEEVTRKMQHELEEHIVEATEVIESE
nr:FAD-dependent oxidoreductase [Alicyclobacillus ferrooxydans]